jgi:hypothetical protein
MGKNSYPCKLQVLKRTYQINLRVVLAFEKGGFKKLDISSDSSH